MGLLLRLMPVIMALAMVDMATVAMVDMDMAVVSMVVVTLEKGQLMQNQRLHLKLGSYTGGMAIQSLLTMATPHLDTMARGLLILNLRQMLDTMEGLAIVVMVVTDMDVDFTVVDIMEKGLLILKLMLDTMEGTMVVDLATVDMVAMDVDSMVVASMARDLLILKLMLDTMEVTMAVDLATVDMVAMDLAMAVVISLVKLLYGPAVYIQFPVKFKVGRNCNNKYLQFKLPKQYIYSD